MFKTFLIGLLVLAVAPLGLIFSQWPQKDLVADAGGLDFSRLPDHERAPAPLEIWTARDDSDLGVRRYRSGNASAPLVVMLHGSGWHGLQFNALARKIADSRLADVVVPDLRGHGPTPQHRGDVAYIGQLEDDISDLIKHEARPGQKVVLLGHSSGGGLALRFAGGRHGKMIDGAILLAPYLGHAAPTTRPQSGGWARPLVRRIIGLSILNRLGITALNGLTVVQFRFPPAILNGPLGATATRSYSYRLNQSYAPRADLAAEIAALPPFLLVAGEKDEAFDAALYQPTLAKWNRSGEYKIVSGAGHLDIVDNPFAFEAIANWLGRI